MAFILHPVLGPLIAGSELERALSLILFRVQSEQPRPILIRKLGEELRLFRVRKLGEEFRLFRVPNIQKINIGKADIDTPSIILLATCFLMKVCRGPLPVLEPLSLGIR